MKTVPPHTSENNRYGLLDRFARGQLETRLRDINSGDVSLSFGDEKQHYGDGTERPISIQVHDPRFFRRVVRDGSSGAGLSYADGWWDCEDLTGLLAMLLKNMELAEQLDRGASRLQEAIARAKQFFRRNSRNGSRRNIHAHYDLGNDFFELFLDPTMTYSCAVFEEEDTPLEEASKLKLDRICRKLDLKRSDHVLEIGCGWGSFAIHAAKQYGCRVTATTISSAQYEFATRRVREEGVEDRVEIIKTDYRDLRGQFDKLVSIEMIEAVGDEYLPTYFGKCSSLLKDDGIFVLQAITSIDQRYDEYLRTSDFIRDHIFPGCCVPSTAALCSAVAAEGNLRFFHLEEMAPHYAKTLRLWREKLHERQAEAIELGYSERLLRLWTFYLCYCEAGFQERILGDVQIVLTKPDCRREPLLPTL
ncbi:MAG: cyclopropane-fatty-acyl-phospholipid synthase family protein [Planctomycetota bacterium]